MKSLTYGCLLLCLITVCLFKVGFAQNPLDSLKQVYRSQQDTIKLETLRRICEQHIQQNDSVYKYALVGMNESKKLNDRDYEGKFLMYLSLSMENSGKYREAIYFGKRAIQMFDQTNNHLWAAGMCREIAETFITMLLYDSAMLYSFKALEYHSNLDVNPRTLEALSSIAHIHELTGNIDQSIEWNQNMLRQSVQYGYPYYESEAYYNLGNVYDLKSEYDSAIYFKKLALRHTSEVKENEYVQLLGSIGNSFMLKGDLDSALYYTSLFYDLSRDEHRSLYRRNKKKALSAINLGALNFKMGNSQLAKLYLNEGIILASQIDYKEKLMEAHEWLYQIHFKNKNYAKALEQFQYYTEFYKEALSIENQRIIQQLTFQFDTKQKAQEISLLRLEAEINETKLQQAKNQLIIALMGILAILIIGFLIITRIKFKQRARLAEEKERNQRIRFKSIIETEENERKRIARELHDSLGQLLSTARLNISAVEGDLNEMKAQQISNSIKLIDNAVNEVRTISHNMMPNALISIGFESALREQVHLINDAGKFKVHLETPNEKLSIPEALGISLYRIVQEILNNALKYSEAENIWIEIVGQHEAISIKIKDDGNGFDPAQKHTSGGIGWNNIHSRIEVINGEISINSTPQKGTSIQLNVAV